jgi:hypothetical protein
MIKKIYLFQFHISLCYTPKYENETERRRKKKQNNTFLFQKKKIN